MTFARTLPLLLLGLLGLVVLAGRSLWQRIRYGGWGWSVGGGSAMERPIQLGGLLLLVLLVAESALWALDLLPLRLWTFVPGAGSEAAGTLGVLLGGVLMLAAQLQMGASWRIGIDAGAPPGLVRHGLYRLSRNPIYLSLFVTLGGFALLMPTWPSLALLVAAVATVRAQVRQEERYLLDLYGEEYRSFQREVGRFVPLLGRVR